MRPFFFHSLACLFPLVTARSELTPGPNAAPAISQAQAPTEQQHQVARPPTPKGNNVPFTLPTGRAFLLNVPEAYDPDAGGPYPLVVSFHGAGGTSRRQQRITELSDPALRIAGRPFLTAYAQGVDNVDKGKKGVWQGAPYANETADDIAYVRDLLAAVSRAYAIDPTRRYACGKSNGGGFVALLTCRPDTAGLFAAYAPVSPALYQGTFAFYGCDPGDRPMSILHVHGVEDTMTPFYGRTPSSPNPSFGPEPDVRLYRRQWAERNLLHCAPGHRRPSNLPPSAYPEPRLSQIHPGVWEEVWDDDLDGCSSSSGSGTNTNTNTPRTNQPEIRALTVEGLGHSWPTTRGLDKPGRPNSTANFNLTSPYLLDFFSRHWLEVAGGVDEDRTGKGKETWYTSCNL